MHQNWGGGCTSPGVAAQKAVVADEMTRFNFALMLDKYMCPIMTSRIRLEAWSLCIITGVCGNILRKV